MVALVPQSGLSLFPIFNIYEKVWSPSDTKSQTELSRLSERAAYEMIPVTIQPGALNPRDEFPL
jgi:hypothetical protein